MISICQSGFHIKSRSGRAVATRKHKKHPRNTNRDMRKEFSQVALDLLENLRLSPSSIRRFEDCRAGYIFNKVILPRTDTPKGKKITNVGSKFHKLAEHDFKKEEVTNDVLADESKKTIDTLKILANALESRDYFRLPSRREIKLEVAIADLGVLNGIPDRVVEKDDGGVIIVDYKTSAFAYPNADKKQLMDYAYIIWKATDADPDNIEIIIDYVRIEGAQGLFRYRLTKADLERHENYIMSRFRGVISLLKRFAKNPDISKISHTPGNCNLCFMVGKCLPYQTMISPHYDPIDFQNVRTVDLLREKIIRSQQGTLLKERLDSINATLMFRLDHDKREVGDKKGRTYKEIIEEHASRVQSMVETYEAKAVIEKLIPIRTKKLIKGIPFSEAVDMQVLQNIITGLILEYVPKRLSKEMVPEDLRSKVDGFKSKSPRSPYLRMKN